MYTGWIDACVVGILRSEKFHVVCSKRVIVLLPFFFSLARPSRIRGKKDNVNLTNARRAVSFGRSFFFLLLFLPLLFYFDAYVHFYLLDSPVTVTRKHYTSALLPPLPLERPRCLVCVKKCLGRTKHQLYVHLKK